jgi:uncharacterized protein
VTPRARTVSAAASGAAALVGAVAGAVGYWASRIVQQPARLAPRRPRPDEVVTVDAADGDQIVLTGPGRDLPGTWGLGWEDGYAVLGPPVAGDDERTRRTLRLVGEAVLPPPPGTVAAMDAFAATADPADVGRPWREVRYDAPLAPTPAWWFPAEGSTTWAIVIHGRSARYHEGFRLVPALVDAGVHVLAIAYRDDPDGPASPDRRSHLGDTEWADVEAAVRLALDGGARDVVLVGYSMGGGIAATFLRRSALAEHVRALVLDAPVLDWEAVIRRAARDQHLPAAALGLLLPVSMAVAGRRAGIDWEALRHDPASITVPTLLVHGDDDRTVPVEHADALAEARSDMVTYLRVVGAGHCRGWNHDPLAYESALTTFLARYVPLVADEPV